MRTLVFSPKIVRKAQSSNQKKKERERAEIWQRSQKENGRERWGKD